MPGLGLQILLGSACSWGGGRGARRKGVGKGFVPLCCGAAVTGLRKSLRYRGESIKLLDPSQALSELKVWPGLWGATHFLFAAVIALVGRDPGDDEGERCRNLPGPKGRGGEGSCL